MIVTQQAAVHLGNDYLVEFTFYQNSAAKNSKTIVRCDKKVGQDRTERKSKNMSMIVEYFSPKIQCFYCLTYWTTSILYWTWRASCISQRNTRQMNRERLVTLPIPHYVTKARVMGTLRDNEFITQFTLRLREEGRRCK